METVWPALVALVLAFFVTLLELVTSKYPRTFFALRRSWQFYVYGAIYGAVAFVVMFFLSQIVDAGAVNVEGFGVGNTWVRAVAIGFSTKALLHIRIFNVTVGTGSFPIGVESLVLLFEPWLLRAVDVEEFTGVRDFLDPFATRYTNLADVKQRITDRIPSSLPPQERSAFLADLANTTTVIAAMELFLRFVGKSAFERTFP